MTDGTQTTRTPGQDGGDPVEKTPDAGTPGGDERDAGSGEPDYKALHLANKDTIEKLGQKVAELEARTAQPPAAQDADEYEEPEGEDWVEPAGKFAKDKDPVARGLLAERAARLQDRKDLVDYLALERLPAEDKDEVRALYQKDWRRLGNVRAAHNEIRARKLEAENAKLREDLARRERNKPDPDVVRTHPRGEVTHSQNEARKVTQAEWDREQAALEDAADAGDAEARAKKYAQQALLRSGKIVKVRG